MTHFMIHKTLQINSKGWEGFWSIQFISLHFHFHGKYCLKLRLVSNHSVVVVYQCSALLLSLNPQSFGKIGPYMTLTLTWYWDRSFGVSSITRIIIIFRIQNFNDILVFMRLNNEFTLAVYQSNNIFDDESLVLICNGV